jgi:uncharacterized glyoxalase superfamily protein PhnB
MGLDLDLGDGLMTSPCNDGALAMTDEAEFYPMPSFATLSVRDLDASLRWYCEALGFRSVFVMPGPSGPPALAHLRWTRYADLLLRAGRPDAEPAANGRGIALTYSVGLDRLDALAERARSYGANFLQEPGDRPWNARDFTVADPDGFALVFTAGPLRRELSLDQVVANARRAS